MLNIADFIGNGMLPGPAPDDPENFSDVAIIMAILIAILLVLRGLLNG